MRKWRFNNWIGVVALFFMGQVLVWGQTREFQEHGHNIQHYRDIEGTRHFGGFAEDKNGYLWLSTPARSYRFDGYTFQGVDLPEEEQTYDDLSHINRVHK